MSNGNDSPAPILGGFKSKLLRNRITILGTAVAVVSLANILFFFLIDFVSPRPSPYTGILAYMVLPAFLIAGLLLIPIGLLWDRKRRGLAPEAKLPSVDFSDPAQRGAFISFASFVGVFLILSAVGSYRAYEFTDSVQFCGQLCHSVMNPEFTAYQLSPHARVACVDCHVGSGASWYVRSKLSGARQVFKTALNTFPRPIPTPVHNLRPAQDTCEQCHWPKKFHGAQLKVITHFGSDEKNTPRQVRLLIKTGGGDPLTGTPSGIHWHMNISNEISYASDDKREAISYVRAKDMQGRVTEFFPKNGSVKPEDASKLTLRRMDCIDCHNRPTHVYVPPDRSVDQALLTNKIDPALPFIKQQGVTVLTAEYKTTDAAMEGIATGIHEFYGKKYPDIEKQKAAQVREAIAELQRIFRGTIFPEMKLDWRTHPDHIGHYYYTGCFRCHDGEHATKEGKTISKECTICHVILGQEESTASMEGVKGQEFKHPVDLGDMTAVSCTDCHTGGTGP